MSKRGDTVMGIIIGIAALLFVVAIVLICIGRPFYGTTACAGACFLVLFAIYLEMYSHRD